MSIEDLDPPVTETIPDDLLEVHEADIDQRQLMDRIEKRVAQRRDELGSDPRRFPSYEGVPYPGTPEGVRYDPDLYHHLRLANKLYPEIETEPVLVTSPATRIPLLGQLWRLVRLHAHNLVLFYVNRAIRHEVDVNRHMVSVLNSLTLANQDKQVTIDRLMAELEELRSHDEK
ncbi:MAG: hypothetical protein WA996_06575 [Candidatus Promineifilaceae bacterium]